MKTNEQVINNVIPLSTTVKDNILSIDAKSLFYFGFQFPITILHKNKWQ